MRRFFQRLEDTFWLWTDPFNDQNLSWRDCWRACKRSELQGQSMRQGDPK